MAIRYPITLSTTEPNNNIGLLKIRQADEETQTLVVEILERGVPLSYEGLQVFFCAKIGQTSGLGIIEQKLLSSEMTNPKNGELEYTLRPEDWQQLGRQTAYFSFRKMTNDHTYVQQFSTRDFTYEVTKNIYSDGIKEVKKDGSTYIWTIEDLKRLYQEYIASGRTDWEEFVNQNREILESVDPGGTILASLGNLVDFRKWDTDLVLKMKNEFEERGGNPLWYGAVGDGEHDDSLALIECFEKHDTIVFPQNKVFKISWDINDRRSFYVFKDRKNIKIEGPSAVIFDSNTYVDRTLNDVLNFENCENVYVSLNGKGYPVSERETDLGYIGSAFVTATKGTKGLTLKGRLENFRYGFRSGDFGNPENGNSANIKVDLDTIDVGYPVACYLTDNVEVNIDAEHVHRAGYFAACKNVRGNIKYAGFSMSRMNVLITNLSVGNDVSKGCSNIRLNVIDDSSYSSISNRAIAGISLQTLEIGTSFENISLSLFAKIGDAGRTLSAFAIKSDLTQEGWDDNWTKDILIDDINISGMIDRSSQTLPNSSWGDVYIDCSAVNAANNPVFRLLNFSNLTVRSNSTVDMNTNILIIPGYVGSIVCNRLDAPYINWAISNPQGGLVMVNSAIKKLTSNLGIYRLVNLNSSISSIDSPLISDGRLKPPLLNGFSEYGSSFESFAITLDAEGKFSFRGMLKRSSIEKNVEIFKLPDNLKQKEVIKRLVITDLGPASININLDGHVATGDDIPTGASWINIGGVKI